VIQLSSKSKSKDDVKVDVAVQDPTVEELAERLGVKPWQIAGLMKAQGWAPGKRIDESEFKAKLAAWTNGPMAR
jgi:uncharacterized protein YjcR